MRLSDHDEWARAHHGLLTIEASGLSGDAWRRAIRAGTLLEVHRGVARLPGAAITPRQRIAAAVFAAGSGVVASHRSAAYLWGLVDDGGPFVHLISRDRTRRRNLAAVVVHRPNDQRRMIPQRPHGIRCTNPVRTLCDLGVDDPQLVEPAVGRALSTGAVDLAALTAAVIEHAQCGRAGIPALRRAIDEWAIDHRPADSVLETAFVALVRRFGLPPVRFHERIEGWEVDFRFVDSALIIECDGWGTHGLDPVQFERDRRKTCDLVGAGWQVLRFSYRAIVSEPAETARRIRRALVRWADVDVPTVA